MKVFSWRRVRYPGGSRPVVPDSHFPIIGGRCGRPYLLAFMFLLRASAAAMGQATHITVPARETLLRFVYQWGEESALGNLRTRPMRPEDVEVRFWQGFGIAGTWGTVLRRRNDQWQAWRVVVQPCPVALPITVGDTISEATLAQYRSQARKTCGRRWEDTLRAATVFLADTVGLYPLRLGSIEVFWQDLKSHGLLELPPRVPRTWMMIDGHTYVVEVRRGSDYRGSVIEDTTPESRADSLVQDLAGMVDRVSDPR